MTFTIKCPDCDAMKQSEDIIDALKIAIEHYEQNRMSDDYHKSEITQ